MHCVYLLAEYCRLHLVVRPSADSCERDLRRTVDRTAHAAPVDPNGPAPPTSFPPYPGMTEACGRCHTIPTTPRTAGRGHGRHAPSRGQASGTNRTDCYTSPKRPKSPLVATLATRTPPRGDLAGHVMAPRCLPVKIGRA